MNNANDTCDTFDAAVFSGDTFTEQRDLVVLQAYLARWQREASDRLQAIQREREKAARERVEIIAKEPNPLLEDLQFEEVTGEAYTYTPMAGLPETTWREPEADDLA